MIDYDEISPEDIQEKICDNEKIENSKFGTAPGKFDPNCDEDTGLYASVQTNPSSGYTWCSPYKVNSNPFLSELEFSPETQLTTEQIFTTCQQLATSDCVEKIIELGFHEGTQFSDNQKSIAIKQMTVCQQLFTEFEVPEVRDLFDSNDPKPEGEGEPTPEGENASCESKKVSNPAINCLENGNFDNFQSDPSSGLQWCAAFPEISENPLLPEFSFRAFHFEFAEEFDRMCAHIQTSVCAREVESMEIYEDYEKIRALSVCQDLIENLLTDNISCGGRPHETFSACFGGENIQCGVVTCSDLTEGKGKPCVALTPSSCFSGCICENGFYRDSITGACVEAEICESQVVPVPESPETPSSPEEEIGQCQAYRKSLPKDSWKPDCRNNGEFKQIQKQARRYWCVANVNLSPEPRFSFMKFFEKPTSSFCDKMNELLDLYETGSYKIDQSKVCQFSDINMHYSECANDCSAATCQNDGFSTKICTQVCQPMCDCQPGYILDKDSSKCVKRDMCQLSCDKDLLPYFEYPELPPHLMINFKPTCSIENSVNPVQTYEDIFNDVTYFYCAKDPLNGDLSILPSSERQAKTYEGFVRKVDCGRMREAWTKLQ